MSIYDVVSTQTFQRKKLDGTIVEWHQEEEDAIADREAAIAMVQRTITFWISHLVIVSHQQQKQPLQIATKTAQDMFKQVLQNMMSSNFAKKWKLKLKDFNYDPDL